MTLAKSVYFTNYVFPFLFILISATGVGLVIDTIRSKKNATFSKSIFLYLGPGKVPRSSKKIKIINNGKKKIPTYF